MDYFRDLNNEELRQLAQNTALYMFWLTLSILYGLINIFVDPEDFQNGQILFFILSFYLSLGFALGYLFNKP